MSNYGTPYDDSFRTLLTDCKRLIVPLVNEMFGENWQETENDYLGGYGAGIFHRFNGTSHQREDYDGRIYQEPV